MDAQREAERIDTDKRNPACPPTRQPMLSGVRSKIVLIVILGSLPIAIFTIVMGIYGIRSTITRLEQEARTLADTIFQLYDKKLDEAYLLLTTLSQIPEMQAKGASTWTSIFEQLFTHSKAYTGLTIATAEGDVIASVPPIAGSLNFSDRPWYRSVMNSRQFTVGEYQLGRINHKPVQVLSCPVLDEMGAVQAILTAGLDLEWIDRMIQDPEIPEDVSFSICDNHGMVSLRYPDPETYVGSHLPESFIRKLNLSNDHPSFLETDLDGIRRYFGFLDFKRSDTSQYMLIGIPQRSVTKRMTKTMLVAVVVIVLILGLSAFITWFAGDRFIVKDIRMLTEVTNQFKSGKFSIRTGSKGKTGEIGDLMRSFDSMAKTIQLYTLDQIQLEEQLKQQLHWTTVLNALSTAIAQKNSVESILQIVMNHLEEGFSFALGGVGLQREDTKTFFVSLLSKKGRELAAQLEIQEGQEIPEDIIGLEKNVQDHRANTMYLADLDTSILSKESRSFFKEIVTAGIGTMVIIPLALQNQRSRFGFIFLFFTRRFSLREYEMSFLHGMAENISLAVQNWKLYEDLDRAYNELKRTQQSVMEQERLNAMGQMASGIAHDINNTLAPISLYTEALLESEKKVSDRGKRFLRTIQQATRDIENTTTRLRKFYRKEEDRDSLQLIGIKELLANVIELTRPRWQTIPQKQGVVIDIRLEVEENLPALAGNESEIRETLINLMINAVDAMENGGILTITAYTEQPYVVLEIGDTGAGMDEEQKRRCLEPFYTSKGDRGTGLGLSMVYGVMQRHGGRLEIQSAIGKGTNIQLFFPHRDEISLAVSPRERHEALPSLHILCIDDDKTVLQSLKDTLQIDGHKVDTVDSGSAGIQVFREQMDGGKIFDMVITDLGMPHMDGYQVAEVIKSVCPQTPVILLSGWGNLMFVNGTLPENIDQVLGKPPKIRELREVLRGIWKQQVGKGKKK